MTQKDLATVIRVAALLICKCRFQKISEKPQVVNEYESGRAIPNQQIIGKLERAVGKGDTTCV